MNFEDIMEAQAKLDAEKVSMEEKPVRKRKSSAVRVKKKTKKNP